MQEEKVVFITGVTGYVGCHLAYSLLADGHTVVALVRASGRKRTPTVRAQDAIAKVDEENPVSFDRLIVIPGDVTDDSREVRARIRAQTDRPFTDIWHCVASFKFTEEEREEIEAVNLQGVHNMLDLVLNLNGDGEKPRYFHVGTAYSSGREVGVVPEEFVRHGNEFRSLYEWSKHEGEAIVADYQSKHNLDVTIFRPSIIVGSPTTTVISYTAYYQVIESLYRLYTRIASRQGEEFDGHLDLRLPAYHDTSLNFVPIDYVNEAMLLIAAEPRLINNELKVFNITNENPVTMNLLHKVASISMGISGIKLVPPEEFERTAPNRLERMMARSTAFQKPYMSEELRWSTEKFRQYVSEEQLPSLKMDEAFLAAINKIFFDNLKENQA